MKYYSDVTKQMYESVEACEEAEKAVLNVNNERKEAAARVEEARKAMTDARQAYCDELTKFCNKYGYYHKTITNKDTEDWKSISDLISDIFSW